MMTKNRLLRTEADPMGAAIRDFHTTGRAGRLRVLSPQFDEDEIPVSHLFRTPDELPAIEAEALRLAVCSTSEREPAATAWPSKRTVSASLPSTSPHSRSR